MADSRVMVLIVFKESPKMHEGELVIQEQKALYFGGIRARAISSYTCTFSSGESMKVSSRYRGGWCRRAAQSWMDRRKEGNTKLRLRQQIHSRTTTKPNPPGGGITWFSDDFPGKEVASVHTIATSVWKPRRTGKKHIKYTEKTPTAGSRHLAHLLPKKTVLLFCRKTKNLRGLCLLWSCVLAYVLTNLAMLSNRLPNLQIGRMIFAQSADWSTTPCVTSLYILLFMSPGLGHRTDTNRRALVFGSTLQRLRKARSYSCPRPCQNYNVLYNDSDCSKRISRSKTRRSWFRECWRGFAVQAPHRPSYHHLWVPAFHTSRLYNVPCRSTFAFIPLVSLVYQKLFYFWQYMYNCQDWQHDRDTGKRKRILPRAGLGLSFSVLARDKAVYTVVLRLVAPDRRPFSISSTCDCEPGFVLLLAIVWSHRTPCPMAALLAAAQRANTGLIMLISCTFVHKLGSISP